MTPLTTSIDVRVRFSEVDSLGMVWHGHYVKYLEDARETFGRQFGLEYMRIFENGYITPIVDMHVKYKHTATVDDILTIHITYRPERGGKLTFDYTMHRKRDNLLILTATTTQLFVTRDGMFEPSCPDFFQAWKDHWHITL